MRLGEKEVKENRVQSRGPRVGAADVRLAGKTFPVEAPRSAKSRGWICFQNGSLWQMGNFLDSSLSRGGLQTTTPEASLGKPQNKKKKIQNRERRRLGSGNRVNPTQA